MTKMKKLKIWLTSITLILLIALIIVLHFYLKHGLNKTIQKIAIPQAEEALKVNVEIGNASINLFRGSVEISKAKIGNPLRFTEPTILSLNNFNVDVGMLALLRNTIKVSSINVDDLTVTLVRNDEGKINLQEIYKRLEKTSAPGGAPPSEPSPEPEERRKDETELPKALIKNAKANALLEYVDHKVSEEVFKIGFNLSLKIKNLATFGNEKSKWGSVNIKGSLKDNPEAFITDIEAKIAPITDTAHPSFDAEGTVASIDMAELKKVSEEMGITGKSGSLALKVKCRDGVFDEKNSLLTLTIINPKLVGKAAKKAKGIPIPEELSIPIPIGGTIQKPDLQFEVALVDVVLKMMLGGQGKEIENALQEFGKSLFGK